MYRILFPLTLYGIGGLLQIILQASLSLPWSAISLPLCILPAVVHFSIVRARNQSLYMWYGSAGLLLELLSPYPFGAYVLMCLISAFVTQWFFDEFITNVSFLSYIFLFFLSVGTYYFTQLFFLFVTGVLSKGADVNYFFTTHGYSILATAVGALLFYGIAQILGRGLMHTHA